MVRITLRGSRNIGNRMSTLLVLWHRQGFALCNGASNALEDGSGCGGVDYLGSISHT